MSETKFTPGPWFPCDHDDGSAICVAFGLGHDTVANVASRDGESPARVRMIAADKALIAAAPNLYAALERLLAAEQKVTHRGGALQAAEAVLAKARGEA